MLWINSILSFKSWKWDGSLRSCLLKLIIIKLVSKSELSKASSFNFDYPSIKTKFLLISKLFSKNTSTCETENKFLSAYSKASWLISSEGNRRSFINYDLPHYWKHLPPAPMFNTPNPSLIMKEISGTYLSMHLSPS